MNLTETIHDCIFARRFGGSVYTRFNQDQLEGKIRTQTSEIDVF